MFHNQDDEEFQKKILFFGISQKKANANSIYRLDYIVKI